MHCTVGLMSAKRRPLNLKTNRFEDSKHWLRWSLRLPLAVSGDLPLFPLLCLTAQAPTAQRFLTKNLPQNGVPVPKRCKINCTDKTGTPTKSLAVAILAHMGLGQQAQLRNSGGEGVIVGSILPLRTPTVGDSTVGSACYSIRDYFVGTQIIVLHIFYAKEYLKNTNSFFIPQHNAP